MKVVFMGTPDFSVPVLQKLLSDGYNVVACVTQPDRPKGRKRELTPPPVKVEAIKQGIDVLQPEKIKDEVELETLLTYQPDLIVTAAFGQILPKALLDYPKYGCINVHASLLPKYRGGAPIHQAIMDGEKETGVTIMYMVEKLDAGDILTQTRVPITETDDVGSLHDKLSVAGASLLSETIPNLIRGKLTSKKQDETLVSFAKNISREQERINWDTSGEVIYNQIRGLRPWPVAYTEFQGAVMKIWRAEKREINDNVEPGVILAIEKDGFIVGTGDKVAIKITELQPAGKKKMSAEQYLRGTGTQVKAGLKLGE